MFSVNVMGNLTVSSLRNRNNAELGAFRKRVVCCSSLGLESCGFPVFDVEAEFFVQFY